MAAEEPISAVESAGTICSGCRLAVHGALHGDVNAFYSIAPQLKGAALLHLGRTLADWRTWLAGNGPIIMRLSVDATRDQATRTMRTLTFTRPEQHAGVSLSRLWAIRHTASP